ncbi:MAG TPA: alpha/beta hydrolase [Balneolaceae bacterium]
MYKITSSFIACIFAFASFTACSDAPALPTENQNKEAPDSNYVTVDDTRIFYREAGEGPTTLILLHGWPLSSQLFQKNISALAEEYHVIVPDLPGFCNSEFNANPQEWGVEDYANDILALMDELGIEQAVIGGMSMGGPIVLSMFEQAPDRFIGMLLIDTIAAPAAAPEKQLWLGWVQRIQEMGVESIPSYVMDEMLTAEARMNNTELVNEVATIMKHASKEGAIAGAYALANRPDFRPLLGSIDVPTLILVGIQDSIYPYEIAQRMQQNISGSELVILDGGNHAAIIEEADAANEAILSWMGEMSPAASANN